jgi:ribosomal protein L29
MSKMSEERREVREMSLESAVEELAKARRNLFDLRMQKARGEVKDAREFAKTRKRIARLMFKIHAETHFAHEDDLAETEEAVAVGDEEE